MIKISPWRSMLIGFVCLGGVFFSLPTLLNETTFKLPSWFPKDQVSLGLDLQGGSHLLLEVDMKSGMNDRYHRMLEDIRRALREEKIIYTNLSIQKDAIYVTIRDEGLMEKAQRALKKIDPHFHGVIHDKKIIMTFDDAGQKEFKDKLMAQTLEIVNRRINELGTKEPNIQRQGDDRIIIQLPGIQDPSHIKNLLGQTAKMSFRLVHLEKPFAMNEKDMAPPGYEVLASEERHQNTPHYNVEKRVLLGGEHLVDAQVHFDEYNHVKVGFRFDATGGRIFADVTRQNINRRLAIVLDQRVISAPNISGIIPSGSGEISGQFSTQEATDLAILMRAGALPAPLNVIEERTVGPDLGADSIRAGQNATIISMGLVALFMIVAYALFGVFTVVALVFNLFLLVAVLALTGSTLTLPGLAGIALTIGMAVDANVLIYERIKEELRQGKKNIPAVHAGYKRAIGTILDSNITTLIGAAALYFWGSGPIKGFGVTLTFGILISMFTSISLSKLLALLWIKWRRPKVLSI